MNWIFNRFSLFYRLQAVVLFILFADTSVATEQQKAIATLDWTVAETLIALGHSPVAVGDKQSYQVWVGEPALPEDTIDLGIRLQPNPEQIWRLAQQFPDQLTFINGEFYQQVSPMLVPFSTVYRVDFYQSGEAWQNMLNATQQIAEFIGKPETYMQLLARYQQKIAEIKPLVQPFQDRPVALVQFSDSRHLRIYAENSLFGAVLKQLGFQNAWAGSHNAWGFEWIEITQLAKLPANSRLVVIKPYPANLGTALSHNTLWQRLPLAQHPLILPPVWTVGGIPSAMRFADILADGLRMGTSKW